MEHRLWNYKESRTSFKRGNYRARGSNEIERFHDDKYSIITESETMESRLEENRYSLQPLELLVGFSQSKFIGEVVPHRDKLKLEGLQAIPSGISFARYCIQDDDVLWSVLKKKSKAIRLILSIWRGEVLFNARRASKGEIKLLLINLRAFFFFFFFFFFGTWLQKNARLKDSNKNWTIWNIKDQKTKKKKKKKKKIIIIIKFTVSTESLYTYWAADENNFAENRI